MLELSPDFIRQVLLDLQLFSLFLHSSLLLFECVDLTLEARGPQGLRLYTKIAEVASDESVRKLVFLTFPLKELLTVGFFPVVE